MYKNMEEDGMKFKETKTLDMKLWQIVSLRHMPLKTQQIILFLLKIELGIGGSSSATSKLKARQNATQMMEDVTLISVIILT